MARYRDHEDQEYPQDDILNQFDVGDIEEAAEEEAGGFNFEDLPAPDVDLRLPDDATTARSGTRPGMEGLMGGNLGVGSARRPSSGRATPSRPRVPTPMAGSTTSGPGGPPSGPPGVVVSPPMDGGPSGNMAVPGAQLRRPGGGFGGGLQGGGLGLAYDPVADETSGSIDGLIEMLLKGVV